MFYYNSNLGLLFIGLLLSLSELRVGPGFSLSGLFVRQVQFLGFVILGEPYVS